MDLQKPQLLLGGLSPAQFMRRHWHKKPLLVRQAIPGVVAPVTRSAMFALAARDDVESRLVEVAQISRDWVVRFAGHTPRRGFPRQVGDFARTAAVISCAIMLGTTCHESP